MTKQEVSKRKLTLADKHEPMNWRQDINWNGLKVVTLSVGYLAFLLWAGMRMFL